MPKKKYYGKGGMISSDSSATANLPQNVMIKKYPEVGYGQKELLNDTISGVDQQMNDDAHGGKHKTKVNPDKW